MIVCKSLEIMAVVMDKLELANRMAERKKSTLMMDVRWLLKMYSNGVVNLDFLNIVFDGDTISYKSENGRITHNVLIQARKLKMPDGMTLAEATKGERTKRKALFTMLFVEEMIIQAFQTYFAHYLPTKTIKEVLPCIAKEYFGHTKYPYFT